VSSIPDLTTLTTGPSSALNYRPVPGLFDEVYSTDGAIKHHWQYLLDSLSGLGVDELNERKAKAQRFLRDDGASYNIYGDSAAPNRSWNLDLVPALIDSAEWAQIEAGLMERAELFNLLLKDIYGKRDLLRHGVIPPEALYCHPGFLRPCQDIRLPGEHELILHGFDLMRDASGKFCVLNDRTQSPSGAGYALENRTVMSRVLPSLFRDSHVHRLTHYFQRLREKLLALAPQQESPCIVVLTAGPHNETYFEQAYIANYLGFHLVQSNDLMVRNGQVWMKSLNGLTRVDVILRTVEDWYCDPVELRGDSKLGVANLLGVARAGRVAIANPLGSGVLENPIFLSYLPAIAKALLGRELRLPSTPSFWCGNPQDLSYVRNNLHSLVIKPIYRSVQMPSVLAAEMSTAQQAILLQRIEKNPANFVAQPVLNVGYLPTFDGAQLNPRPAILRSFAIANGTSYTIMPGGLTRVGIQQTSFIISNQSGSLSKDTWVIASEPERADDQASTNDHQPLANNDEANLPSRVAENLFWMGRYIERAETTLHLLKTISDMLNGDEELSLVSKQRLLTTVTKLTATQPGFIAAPEALLNAPEAELFNLVSDGKRPGSVRHNLEHMLNCAEEAKELLASEMLPAFNAIRDTLSQLDYAANQGFSKALEETLDPLLTSLMVLSGLTQESMERSTGWRFMEIGRRLERAEQTATLIRELLASDPEDSDSAVLMRTLLLSLKALNNYRRRYGAWMEVKSCLDLVLIDPTNPRSLLFQLEKLQRHLSALPAVTTHSRQLLPEDQAALEAVTRIKLAQLDELSVFADGKHGPLDNHLNRVSQLLSSITALLADKYFDHKQTSQQLVRSHWESPA